MPPCRAHPLYWCLSPYLKRHQRCFGSFPRHTDFTIGLNALWPGICGDLLFDNCDSCVVYWKIRVQNWCRFCLKVKSKCADVRCVNARKEKSLELSKQLTTLRVIEWLSWYLMYILFNKTKIKISLKHNLKRQVDRKLILNTGIAIIFNLPYQQVIGYIRKISLMIYQSAQCWW